MKFVRAIGIEAIVSCGQIMEDYWNEMAELEGHELTDIERVRLRSHMCLKFVDPSCSVNIAISEAGIHGFCATGFREKFCRDEGLVAHIHDMYVSKDFRGTVEVVSGLYKTAENWAKELGCSYLEGNVSLFNDRVVTLLSKRGFKPIRVEYSKKLERENGQRRSRKRSKGSSGSGSSVLSGGNGSPSPSVGSMAGKPGIQRNRRHNRSGSKKADELRRTVHSKANVGGSGSGGEAKGSST